MSEYETTKHQLWIDRISNPANQGMDQYTWYKSYSLGYRKPNHPLPAIPYRVEYLRSYEQLCCAIDNPNEPMCWAEIWVENTLY